MKFKSAAQRSAVIIIILILSMLCGYVYQLVGHAVDLKKHPREFSEYVTRYSGEYGVPEYIVYAAILTASDFQSNRVSEDGRIGLLQISPETFGWLTSLTKESLETGILYDPETNIRYGTYMLSYLFTEYGRWQTVFAVWGSDEEQVRTWMKDPDYTDEAGNLQTIPDEELREFVEKLEKESDLYQQLYYINH